MIDSNTSDIKKMISDLDEVDRRIAVIISDRDKYKKALEEIVYMTCLKGKVSEGEDVLATDVRNVCIEAGIGTQLKP